jgi:hypothetical protein
MMVILREWYSKNNMLIFISVTNYFLRLNFQKLCQSQKMWINPLACIIVLFCF